LRAGPLQPGRVPPLKRALFAARADQPEGALFPLPSQLSMFADESARPQGLHYRPDFISAQEEAALIGHIRALPLAPFQFGIYEGKRRVVFFGSRLNARGYTAPPWLSRQVGYPPTSSAGELVRKSIGLHLALKRLDGGRQQARRR